MAIQVPSSVFADGLKLKADKPSPSRSFTWPEPLISEPLSIQPLTMATQVSSSVLANGL